MSRLSESPEVPLSLYLHQLGLLGDLNMLSRQTTTLFNLFSGIDLYPLHFVNRMHTLDRRLHQDQISQAISHLRSIALTICIKHEDFGFDDDFFPLPASVDRVNDVHHSDVDLFSKTILDAWGVQVAQASDPVFFLKQVLQYGEAFNGAVYCDRLFADLKYLMPSGSLAVVVENPGSVTDSLASKFSSDGDFEDEFAVRLTIATKSRLESINEKVRYIHALFELGAEKFQLMYAGKLSVFRKKKAVLT